MELRSLYGDPDQKLMRGTGSIVIVIIIITIVLVILIIIVVTIIVTELIGVQAYKHLRTGLWRWIFYASLHHEATVAQNHMSYRLNS